MDPRIEGLPHRLHRSHIQPAQHLIHLLRNQLHAGAQLLRRAGRVQGQPEVVQDRQELLDSICNGKGPIVGTLALLTLPRVVELRLQPRQPIDEAVPLRPQALILFVQARRRLCDRRGCRGCSAGGLASGFAPGGGSGRMSLNLDVPGVCSSAFSFSVFCVSLRASVAFSVIVIRPLNSCSLPHGHTGRSIACLRSRARRHASFAASAGSAPRAARCTRPPGSSRCSGCGSAPAPPPSPRSPRPAARRCRSAPYSPYPG